MLSINHTSTASIRLSLLRNLCQKEKKILYITDNSEDITIARIFARELTGKDWKEIDSLPLFWHALTLSEGFFFLSVDIMRVLGNLTHLERQSSIVIRRNDTITEESCIESLISLGYTHGDASDTPGTYRKTGGTITLRDACIPQSIQLEWFDTDVDSIILNQNGIRSHIADIRISAMRNTISVERSESINTALWESIGSDFFVVLAGGDFIEEKEQLLKKVDIHMGNFLNQSGISVDGSLPVIGSIIDLEQLLRDTTIDTHIYTRYRRTIEEFVEYNQIPDVHITEVGSSRLMSGLWTMPARFSDSIDYTIPTQEESAPDILLPQEQFPRASGGQKKLIIADDLLGEIFVKKRTKKSIAKHLDLLLTLSPGDYIVHREHGIALFSAVVKKTLGEIEREYLELHYAEGDKLFVPLTEIYRVSRYIGNNSPELTRLSSAEWERTMKTTNEEIEAIAADILETSAKRSLAKGRAFGVFREEERIFQEAFSYDYTLDQKSAIDEIYADMESEHPMDRLISGDVGFGKTEVAMNAIYKAVLSGTQVAVLSPLLVLADEHYETFCERLSPFGVRVGVLTRMSSTSEITNTLDGMKNGTIDVVVGTHRLISDDVTWKRLGLLIIDEEHKFGVSHKEKIKKIKANLDILSLSATPIPRSLNLALSGLKKISILATPPKLKKPIETIVTKWNEGIIRSAILHELAHDGQVIIIHNRIRGMESIEREIEMILKEGKMKNESEVLKNTGKIDDSSKMVSNAPLIRGDQGGLISGKNYTHLPYNSTLTTKAQENRKNMNTPEKKFWFDVLKQEPLSLYKFTKQKPILEYIVDFYCSELGLVIEIDGESHVENLEYDKNRTIELSELGLTVIRYTNQDVMMHTEGVYENLVSIIKAKKKQTPLPPLSGGQDEPQKQESNTSPISTLVMAAQRHTPRIIITHGQMPAEQIEDRIHAFKKREYNILLTTTIIENGVNFLSANTIIIIDPEEFGLASLHQLRGRVGRKDREGRCYLMYRKGELERDAKERLITIANNTHLGAGFEIAMRDMEIRGAGDVLGIKQAGKSKDVGLTLYFRMLEEKVEELKNARKTRTWTKIELELSYVIPEEYFGSEADKLSFYREIENIETLEELDEIEEEMIGKELKYEIASVPPLEGGMSEGQGSNRTKQYPPTPLGRGASEPKTKTQQNHNISNLFLLLRARIILTEYGVTKLSKVGMNYTFDFAHGVDVVRIRSFLDRFDRHKNYVLLGVQKIRVETRYYKNIVDFLGSLR